MRAIPLPAAGHCDVLDAPCPGLVLRVSSTGRKAWLLRADGRRTTIGTYPSVTLAEARRVAAEMRHELAAAITVQAAAEQFIRAHAVHLRSGDQLEWLIRKHVLPHIGSKPIGAIGRAEVSALLRAVQGPDSSRRVRVANLTRAALARMFRWCVSEGLAASNSAAAIEPRRGERARDRVLSDDELVAICRVCEGVGRFNAIVRLLILTGQRRDEVANMRWAEVERDLWRLPASRMKAGRPHTVPLASAALLILIEDGVPGGDLVFGEPAFTGWSKSKARLDRLSGVTAWRLQDLRRTAASGMVRLGVARDIVDQVLAHTVPGAGATYMRDENVGAMRDALDRWADHVAEITAPRLL